MSSWTSDGKPKSGGERGQTALDFALGVSVFLATMLFIFAFVPGILAPFDPAGDEHVIVSDRLATELSEGLLGNASEPHILEETCTVSFFSSSPPHDHCNFEGGDVQERLGLESFQNVNVSIQGSLDSTLESEILCWDDSALVNCEDDNKRLATGGTPPSSNDATVSARRIVSLDQHDVTLKVVVW